MDIPTTLDAITISAAVMALVQLAKWAGLPDHFGPMGVIVFSIAGVIFWGYSHNIGFAGSGAWEYFTATINVALSAAGLFGFSRASASAVTKALPPPSSGAGSNPTTP